MIIFISDKKRNPVTFLVICFKSCKKEKKNVKRQAHIFNISFAWAHLVGHPHPTFTLPLLLLPPTHPSTHPQHSPSVRGNQNKRKSNKKDKCRINILYTLVGFLLSNRIWSFTICYQVTEAWLAPFVCGGLFCPVPYMEDRGGAVWWAEPHPPNEITV